MIKYYQLIHDYNEMPPSKQVEILWDALDLMSQYNGRSRYDCIVLAMGGDIDDINEMIEKGTEQS